MPLNSNHPQYEKFMERWQRCRDVAEGSDAVKYGPNSEKYLPKLKDQDAIDYDGYKARAVFYNATWRVISGLLGMLFRQPPAIDMPDGLDELQSDIDGQGKPLQLFAQEVAEHALTVGRVGLLVDHPPVEDGVSQADVLAEDLRPTINIYRAEAIKNWRIERINGKQTLTRVVLEEIAMVPKKDDAYVDEPETRYRVLELVAGEKAPGGAPTKQYVQELYRLDAGPAPSAVPTFTLIEGPIVPRMNNKPLSFIPFLCIGTDDVDFDCDAPPLIDLVDMNLAHYRNSATYERCLLYAPPTLLFSGFQLEDGQKIQVGATTALVQSSAEARAAFVEPGGTAWNFLTEALTAKQEAMSMLGSRMLEPRMRAVETAETAGIHRKGEESLLSSIAQALSLGFTQALKWAVEWAGKDPAKVKAEINRDFFPAPMDAPTMLALLQAWQQGAISDQVLFANLQQGQIIEQDMTLEQMQEQIKSRGPQLMPRTLPPAPPVPPGEKPGDKQQPPDKNKPPARKPAAASLQ